MTPPEREPLTDEALLRRIREDAAGPVGRAAASELFGRYRGRVYLWCYRFVRHHERAMDLAQDALVSAYRGLHSFEGRSSFSSWLFAIARNHCRSAMRPVSLTRDEEADIDVIPDPGRDPAQALEARDAERHLLELVRRHLDPIERDALWLRCFHRMPVDEITRMLEITAASGARGVLQSARRKLRAVLAREAEDESGRAS